MPVALHRIESFFPRACCSDAVFLPGKIDGEHLPRIRVIVDNE